MKKTLITIAIIIAVIVALCVLAHYMPIWVSILTAVVFMGGGVVGWIAKVWYDKYIKE